MGATHTPTTSARRIYIHYQKAHVDYADLFLKMYITYNAWYREVTGTTNDRQAISSLKKRFVIWDDYSQGKTLTTLKPYMERLCELSQGSPFPSIRPYWDGEVSNPYDWNSLIEFWYQVRCLVVHGSDIRPKYAWLAYETLDIFMGEIVDRMQACFSSRDLKQLEKITSLAPQNPQRTERFNKLQHSLYQKYVSSPDLWQVDMQRVPDTSA